MQTISQRYRLLSATSILLATLLSRAALAATIHVPADQPTIQAAINAASNGDTVLVAPGTYYENINFLGKAITVTSSGGPSVTTINGSAVGTVVMFRTNEGRNSVLNGFTVTNGNSYYNYQNLGILEYSGGGILISSASPTITNNIITGNSSCGHGGGIAAQGSAPLIEGNIITKNNQGSCSGGDGGGIYVDGSAGGGGSAKIIGNTISNNVMGGNSNGGNGGGVALYAAGSVTVQNNIISANTATGISPAAQGGGIYIVNDSEASIVQNLIYGNNAGQVGNNTGGQGGGIYFGVPSGSRGPFLINNTIANNQGAEGSGVYANGYDSQVEFFDNLVVASPGQPALYCDTTYGQTPQTFENNDAFSSGGNGFDGGCAGVAGTNGNISTDPLFLDASNNFHLESGSPTIDSGSNSAPNLPSTDLDGNPRIVNSVVDMGAFEFYPATDTVSPASLFFGSQGEGTTSPAQIVTVTNTGATNLLLGIIVDASFAETDNCGSPVVPGGNCFINVTFAPTTSGPISGNLAIRSNATGSPQTVSLSGTGLAPAVSLTPTSLAFGSQLVGTTSDPQTVTLTNTGGGTLNISVIVAGTYGGWNAFSESNTCGTSLVAGASCTINVYFAPQSAGNLTGALQVFDNAPGGLQSVTLSGTGTGPAATLVPSTLSFSAQQVGSTSGAQVVTLTSTGTTPLMISVIYASANFGETNNCGFSLAAGASCTIYVTFSPQTAGSLTGTLVVYDNAADSPQTVALSGTGTPPAVSLAPATLSFGAQQLGTTSAAQIVLLSNSGSGSVAIFGITASANFAQTNNCGNSLAAGSSCMISVTFDPSVAGPLGGSLMVSDNAQNSPQTSALSGTGTMPAAVLSPASLAFPNQTVGTTSGPMNALLSNTGSAPLTITGITISGDFAETNNCGTSLGAGLSCSVSITFTPSTAGGRSGLITVVDNASGSPQTVLLSGDGVDFGLSASPSSITVKSGRSALYTVTATALGGSFSNSISPACSGLPVGATCLFSPASLAPGSGTASAALTVTTTKRTGNGGTPAGTYRIVVTGAFGSLTHNTIVTLTVN